MCRPLNHLAGPNDPSSLVINPLKKTLKNCLKQESDLDLLIGLSRPASDLKEQVFDVGALRKTVTA